MKLTIPRLELVRALAAVKSAAASNSELPILANVLLVANEKSLTITGTDHHITIRQSVEAAASVPGKTTVRAGLFHDIARSANGENVTLEMKKSGGASRSLHVECGSVKFTLSTLDAEDFPPMVRLGGDAVNFELDEAQLHSLLTRTIFASSLDETRLVLCSSFIQLNGKLNVAACDGRRLGLITIDPNENFDPDVKIDLILPNKLVRELLRLLETDPEKSKLIKVSANEQLIKFEFDQTTVISTLIEGKYPNFRQIIPKTFAAMAKVQRVDLLHAVERILLVADGVSVELQKQSLFISSSRAAGDKREIYGEANDTLLCECKDEAKLVLNARYLRDALNSTQADEIELHATEKNIAMLKSPSESWLAVIAGMGDGSEKSDKTPETKPADKK